MFKKLLFKRIERKVARYLRKQIPKEKFIDDFRIDMHVAVDIRFKVPEDLTFEEEFMNTESVLEMYRGIKLGKDILKDFHYYKPRMWDAEILGYGYPEDKKEIEEEIEE